MKKCGKYVKRNRVLQKSLVNEY